MKLQWSRFAFEDRIAIFDYIEQDNPRVALRVDERIKSSIERLTAFPEMGRVGRVDGTRELVISNTPYIAAYQIMEDAILILRILHGAQPWPEKLSDILQ